MSKTNSNSMTGLLIFALNNEDSEFRNAMFKYFKEQIDVDIPEKTIFYDGTHQPLLYKEMNGKEIDIIAREPGKRKPVLMIEVKTGLWENLQESQSDDGEYQKTAEKYGLPLLYIIPRHYAHESEIPKNAKRIEWEAILDIARKHGTYLAVQIEHFVELSEEDEVLSKEELALLTVKSLLENVYETKNKVLDKIKLSLQKYGRELDKKQPYQYNQYGVGYYYNYSENKFFIGFTPYLEGDRFLALCIEENTSTDKDDKLYYEDGWYFVPIQDSNCMEGDKEVLSNFRKSLNENNIVISKSFEKSLSSFYTLQVKIIKLTENYAKEKSFPKQHDGDEASGFYFGETGSDYFIGLSFENSLFSLNIHQSLVDKNKSKDLQENGDYYAFPLNNYTEQFNNFINSSSSEELQKNFNALVDAAKKEADKYRK